MTTKEFQDIRSTASEAHGKPLLLVIDDEFEICTLVCRYFSAHGFDVLEAHDAADARRMLEQHSIDLILLDLGLPGEDGLAFTRMLRSHWHGGLIIVSGQIDATERIVGLELGADDYVCKPFELRELLARVRSLLRRTKSNRQHPTGDAGQSYVFSGFRLDIESRRLTRTDGSEIALTSGEFDVLCAFLENPNHVLSRDQLMQRVHGRDAGPFDRAIDVQIGRLRQKIEADPASPALVKSVRGVGYLLTGKVLKN